MTDRLRKLDALFAEKVLGCKVERQVGGPVCRCNIEAPHNKWDECCGCRFCRLEPYTRSLDAAWEGALKVVEFIGVEGNDLDWYAWVRLTDSQFESVGKDGHPAEALVLACLRAVGVSEEELK